MIKSAITSQQVINIHLSLVPEIKIFSFCLPAIKLDLIQPA
jgi:hypothetical protein